MILWNRKEKMECKEFEKLIPQYLARKLDFLTLKRFYDHREQCKNCGEELDIQFLVTEGIHHLEDGKAFDSQHELNQRLEETKRKIIFHSFFLYLGIVMEITAVGLLVGIIAWILF